MISLVSTRRCHNLFLSHYSQEADSVSMTQTTEVITIVRQSNNS